MAQLADNGATAAGRQLAHGAAWRVAAGFADAAIINGAAQRQQLVTVINRWWRHAWRRREKSWHRVISPRISNKTRGGAIKRENGIVIVTA